ncbi:hypothetical protein EDD22DRAFT_851568 [Suillus occidentalis]|nr:hypothetical protein EDD22DRAFT_851568 [Suillus occidentalis]
MMSNNGQCTPESSSHLSKSCKAFLSPLVTVESKSKSESECKYEGGVNHILSEPDLYTAEPCDNERMSDTDKSLKELEGTDLEENLRGLQVRVNVESSMKSGYAKVAAPKIVKTWQKAEKNQMFVINKSTNQATVLSPSPLPAMANVVVPESGKTFFGYISDLSSDSELDADIKDSNINSSDTNDNNQMMPTVIAGCQESLLANGRD